MTTKRKAQYKSLTERYVVEKALKTLRKAKARNRTPLHKIYSARDLAILESHGWKVHTYNPVSYGAARSWLMIPTNRVELP